MLRVYPPLAERDAAASTPGDTLAFPTPALANTVERSATAPHPPSNSAETRPLPRTTLRLPAVDPTDLSPKTLQIRPTLARLSAMREQDRSRLPRTTLRLPALHPEPEPPAAQELKPLAQRKMVFIAGTGETSAMRLAHWRTPTRLRLLFRLALLPLVAVLLLGLQGRAPHLTGDCSLLQIDQPSSCLAQDPLLSFSSALLSPSPHPLATKAHPPASTGPHLPVVPTNLPSNVYTFIQLALPYAFQAHEKLGWQTSVILAQWGLEEGWYVPTATGYNWGNVRSVPGAPTVSGPHLSGSFAYAATPAAGLRYYLYAAHLAYYTAVTVAARQGANATAVALGRSPWDAGHYTTIGQPGSSLLALLRRYDLYRLD